nr:DUF4268 domain-containing protein [Desulfovibrio sp.]
MPIRTADAAFFSATRLLSMRSRNSAAYKGLMALVWKARALDLLDGTEMDAAHAIEERPDIHHVFPKKWCLEYGDEYARANMDSIVNKTPLTPKANKFIGGDAPSVYAERLKKKGGVGQEALRTRIESHLVDWSAFSTDAFRPHFIARAKKLLNLIEGAMGRNVADRGSAQTTERFGASLEGDAPDSTPAPSLPPVPAPEPAPEDPRLKKPAPSVDPSRLFSAIWECVSVFGGVEARRPDETYASFFAGKGRFLAAVQQKDRVKLFIIMKGGELEDPQELTTPGNRDGERIASVQSVAELEASMPLIRQAYEAAVKDSARDEEALFGNVAPNVRGAWDALKARVLALDGAGLSFRDGYPFFASGGRLFLAAVPQKTSLKIYLGVPEGKLDDPDGKAVLMKNSSRGVGDYKVFAKDATDVDVLMPLVMQALGEEPVFPEDAPAVALYARLKEGVRAFGDVRIEVLSHYVFLSADGKLFAAVDRFEKEKLDVFLRMEKKKLDDPAGLAKDAFDEHGPGSCRITASSVADVDNALPLVRQSFDEALNHRKSFATLTAFLPRLRDADFGQWRDGERTGENSWSMPYVDYATVANEFMTAIWKFAEERRALGLYDYLGVLDRAGIRLNCSDVSHLNGQTVAALVFCALRADRFCEGAFLGCLKDGRMAKWLTRLKELDDADAEAGKGAGAGQASSGGESADPAHEGMNEADAVRLWPAVEAFAKDHGREPSAGAVDPSERRLADVLAFMRTLKAQKMREEQEVEAGDGKDGGKPEDSLDAIMPLVRQARETAMAKAQEMDPASVDSLGLRFWTAFCGHAAEDPEMQASFRPRKPQPQSWHEFPSGVPSIGIELCVRTRMKCVQAGLYFHGRKDLFAEFRDHEAEVATALDAGAVVWKEAGKDCRFYVQRPVEPKDESSWPEAVDWLCVMSLKLKNLAQKWGKPAEKGQSGFAVLPSVTPSPDLERMLETILLGLAVGDATGVPFEFMARGTFKAEPMQGGGAHGQPAGTWSDDTALALAFADSLRSGGFDAEQAGRN